MPKQKVNNHQHIMFRYFLIIVGMIFFAGIISYKLFRTTIIDATHWNEKASKLIPDSTVIYPERGDILAADGSVLVTNLCYYNIHIDFRSEGFKKDEFIKSLDALCDSLTKYYPHRSRQEWHEELLKGYNRDPKPRYFRLLRNINFAQFEQLKTFPFFNIDNSFKTGMIVVPNMRRSCPYGSMARRSIGQVGQTETCSEVHGISGLERAIDSLLYGKPGVARPIILTRTIGKITDRPAINGYNVTTTIDINMQDMLERELNNILDSCGAEWGCAVLMEVATGDIKAISNLEYDRSSRRYIEAYNRAVVAYEPGSVVKPISMMFALEKGYCPPLNQKINIGSSFAYAKGRAITDSHSNPALTPAEVIERSSNIGMTKITIRGFDSDPEGFVRCFEEIGFFEKMNSGIFEEMTPRMSRHPSRIDMSRMCFGYATAIPPLYTLSVYNAIANGGRYVRPRLVKGLSRDGVDSIIPVSYIRDRICSESNAAILRKMLAGVVEGPHGTGRRLRNNFVSLAGKTGTCYHIDTVTGRYDNSKKRLAFCGFFPADKPQYSCMVLTFHPTRNMFGAASTSGEVFKNIALKMYSRGMLGDYSDYTADKPAHRTGPVIYGTEASAELAQNLGKGNSPKQLRGPESTSAARPDSIAPSVKNLGLREAVVRLEQAGFDVEFHGTGRVVSQAVLPGTKRVRLTLSNS